MRFIAFCMLFVPAVAGAQDLQPPPPITQPQPQPQPQPQTQPQPQPAPTDTGQLAPPPPMQQQTPPPAPTEQRLDQSKKEDSGRGLEFFYLNAQGGVVFDALGSFSSSLQITQTNAAGAMIGAEAGVRFVWFTVGMRFRYEMLQPFNLWQLNLVAGFHVPAGKWDPYVSIHGGYSAIGSLDPNKLNDSTGQIASVGSTPQDAANSFTTKGANVGIAVGADYYFVPAFSIGVDAEFELLFLHQDPLALPAACQADPNCVQTAQHEQLYSVSGDAAGIGVLAQAHLALHL